MRQTRLVLCLLIAFIACLHTPLAARAERDRSVGIGLDLKADSGSQQLDRINTGGGDLDENREDLSNDGLFGMQLWVMFPLSESLRLGGALHYHFFRYAFEYDDGRGDAVELGQLFELAARAEFMLPVSDPMALFFGAEAGIPLLLPGGQLADEIDRLQGQGFDTWDVPRLGILLGPYVGARFKLEEWVALRADIALLWQNMFLLDSSAESGGLEGEVNWSVSLLRVRLGLALEFMF